MTRPAADARSPSERHRAVRRAVGGDPVTITVKGGCMAPWIEDDARVEVTPAAFYWPGDVVVALSADGRYLVHRVIGCYRRSAGLKVLTQADAAVWPDAAVSPAQILGRVSGGECHPRIVSVPLAHRLKALFRFARFGIRRSVGTF